MARKERLVVDRRTSVLSNSTRGRCYKLCSVASSAIILGKESRRASSRTSSNPYRGLFTIECSPIADCTSPRVKIGRRSQRHDHADTKTTVSNWESCLQPLEFVEYAADH